LVITACSGSSGSVAPVRSSSSSSVSSNSASSSSVPLRSDAAACREFASWYRQFGPHDRLADTSKMVILEIAVSEAPSGRLHQHLSALESDVITGSKATGSLRQPREQMTVNAAQTVVRDCQSANPDS